MTNLDRQREDQKSATEFQQTPRYFSDDEYMNMIIKAIEILYVDTDRALSYSDNMIVVEDDTAYFTEDLPLDEKRYVLLTAQKEFFAKVQKTFDQAMSYTTNAMSVTGADRPYANLKDTISNIEQERRIVYYKMTRFCM